MLKEKRKKREKRKERNEKKTTTYLTILITVRSAILHVKHAVADANYLPHG
jgi:hypothetical protein